MKLHDILNAEHDYAEKLNKIVDEALQENKLISRHLLDVEADREKTFGQALADRIAYWGGSWTFILIFAGIVILWILLNVSWFVSKPFDPYPFILLNLVLSCLAALQAPVIMMSQNRQEQKDRRRDRSDFVINLKAEMEIRNLQQKMDLLLAEQMHNLFEIQREQLALLRKMELRLNKSNKDQEPKPPEL